MTDAALATTQPTWEQVLAAVEQDALRAAALLAPPAPAVADAHEPAVPAEWSMPGLLPALEQAAPLEQLPPLDQMPPVPAELRDRIESLQNRIRELQRELTATLGSWTPPPRRSVLVPVGAVEQPHYVDRRV